MATESADCRVLPYGVQLEGYSGKHYETANKLEFLNMGNRFLPINVLAKDRNCLVVGGGAVALRKVDTLLDYGVKITLVAPEVNEKLAYYGKQERITIETRAYKSPEAKDYNIVISASDSAEVNRQVHDDCEKAGVLLNVVDQPSLCNFIFPAIMTRDCLTISVSSDGKAPFLSSHLRMVLESIFSNHWNKIAKLATEFRGLVQERYRDDGQQKAACFQRFLDADWKELIKEKKDPELHEELKNMLG